MTNTTNEYLEQAKDFCNNHNVTIEIVFSHKGFHFEDDKQKRDIYTVTIKRGTKSYTFNYGDSIHNTEKNYDRNNRRLTRRLTTPSEYNILACSTKYEVGDFDEFIDEFGYSFETEKEYIKIKQIHINVKEEYKNIYNLFSDCMEELSEIQ